MSYLKLFFNALVVLFVLLANVSINFAGEDPWRDLLAENVTEGLVDYHGIHQNLSVLDEYMAVLKKSDIQNMSSDEQLAFYINGYNACTIKLIIDNLQMKGDLVHFVESIKDIGSFFSSPWKVKFCNLGGKEYTLDEVEHEVIRKQFDDPRVHFALNCASKSCPPLMAEPYDGAKLDLQLNNQTSLFVNDTQNNYFKDNTLYVSKIFDWYEDDFQDGVIPFFTLFAEEELKYNVTKVKDQLKVKYLTYDWSLNKK